MAAATRDRETKVKDSPRRIIVVPIAADTKIYKGTLVTRSSGRAIAAVSNGGTVIGVAREQVDNTGGANDAKLVEVVTGVHRLPNDGTNPCRTPDELGKVCYVVDDQTVARVGTAIAGQVEEVTAEGVWVRFLDEALAAFEARIAALEAP